MQISLLITKIAHSNAKTFKNSMISTFSTNEIEEDRKLLKLKREEKWI